MRNDQQEKTHSSGRVIARAFFFVATLALGFWAGYTYRDWRPFTHRDQYTATCERVVDGDTIHVIWQGRPEKVRLVGLDCPETRYIKKLQKQSQDLDVSPNELREIGLQATRFLEERTSNRDIALVFPSGTAARDSFGRLLCYIEVEGHDVGLDILEQGLAYVRDEKHIRSETYRAANDRAKRNKVGIYAGTRR